MKNRTDRIPEKTNRRKFPGYRAILRAPFFLFFLYLYYLLAQSFVRLIKGFSLSLGFSETFVQVISGGMLVFLLFIGAAILVNYVKNSPDR